MAGYCFGTKVTRKAGRLAFVYHDYTPPFTGFLDPRSTHTRPPTESSLPASSKCERHRAAAADCHASRRRLRLSRGGGGARRGSTRVRHRQPRARVLRAQRGRVLQPQTRGELAHPEHAHSREHRRAAQHAEHRRGLRRRGKRARVVTFSRRHGARARPRSLDELACRLRGGGGDARVVAVDVLARPRASTAASLREGAELDASRAFRGPSAPSPGAAPAPARASSPSRTSRGAL